MSDKVEIIIEIPKEDYEFTKGAETARVFPSEYYVKLILNGILLDDVKAEIEASMYCDKDTRLVKNANASGLEKAIEILDNIGKESEEQ